MATKEQTAHKVYDVLRENYPYMDDWSEILRLASVLIRQERIRQAESVEQAMRARKREVSKP